MLLVVSVPKHSETRTNVRKKKKKSFPRAYSSMLCNARNEKMLTRSRHFLQKGRTSMRLFRIISIPSRVSYFRCQTT